MPVEIKELIIKAHVQSEVQQPVNRVPTLDIKAIKKEIRRELKKMTRERIRDEKPARR